MVRVSQCQFVLVSHGWLNVVQWQTVFQLQCDSWQQQLKLKDKPLTHTLIRLTSVLIHHCTCVCGSVGQTHTHKTSKHIRLVGNNSIFCFFMKAQVWRLRLCLVSRAHRRLFSFKQKQRLVFHPELCHRLSMGRMNMLHRVSSLCPMIDIITRSLVSVFPPFNYVCVYTGICIYVHMCV